MKFWGERNELSFLKVFDDVITTVEEKPADVSDACSRLTAVGKMHRAKVNLFSKFL